MAAPSSSSSTELYRPIPHRIVDTNMRKLKMEDMPDSPDKFIKGFLSARVDSKKMKGGLLTQLRLQTMLLDPPYKAPKVVDSHRSPKKLSARKKREMKIYEIPKDKQRYELFLPLHKLWMKYMEDLLQLGPHSKTDINKSQLNLKVVKADYHGSLLRVCRSKCPSYIGTEGILLQETQNTLKLICKDDRIRTIPKANSIFSFKVHGYQFSIYGNHMKFRASERSARKFKDKPSIDL